MTIKNPSIVEKYAQQVMEIRGVIENLEEFVSSLPAPDENENIPGMDYGHLGTIDHVHTLLTEAFEAIAEFDS